MDNSKTQKNIKRMSVLGIILSVFAMLGTGSMKAFIILGALPLLCSLVFLIKKNPVFGIAYTVLFFVNRISILLGGLLLARVGIVLILVYFIYVDYISMREWVKMRHGER